MKTEIIHVFASPYTVISDNATNFTTTIILNGMDKYGVTWEQLLAYAPMANHCAERIVRILNKSVATMVA